MNNPIAAVAYSETIELCRGGTVVRIYKNADSVRLSLNIIFGFFFSSAWLSLPRCYYYCVYELLLIFWFRLIVSDSLSVPSKFNHRRKRKTKPPNTEHVSSSAVKENTKQNQHTHAFLIHLGIFLRFVKRIHLCLSVCACVGESGWCT